MKEEEYKKLIDSLYNHTCKQMDDIRALIEKDIEHTLRNKVVPPIKGEITKGKIQWRGITCLVYKEGDLYPIGIRQRGNLILFKNN